ncbi:hypothetical protein ACA910_018082 [Epithemia clementina (nom. ined.)]
MNDVRIDIIERTNNVDNSNKNKNEIFRQSKNPLWSSIEEKQHLGANKVTENENTNPLIIQHDTSHPSVREQSRRFSQFLLSQTELHQELYHQGPEQQQQQQRQELPPQDDDKPNEKIFSTGFGHWIHELGRAKEHGGDFDKRWPMALRAALGSLLVFSALVIPNDQQHQSSDGEIHQAQFLLGAVWIGNVFMLVAMQDSLGASVLAARDLGLGILFTTAFSFPVAAFLTWLDTLFASLALPVLAFLMTFLLMSCPQLASRNVMVLIMYIIISPVVREKVPWWLPLGWTATFFIGLTVAILVNLLPKPNLTLSTIHDQLTRLEKDFAMLLRQCQHYGENASSASPSESRGALASIAMLNHRINMTIQTLQRNLPAAQTELYLTCRPTAAQDLSEWIDEARQLSKLVGCLCQALTNRVLGEEYHFNSPPLQVSKGVYNAQMSPYRDRLFDAMVSSIAVCHAWADPYTRRVVLPDVQEELQAAMEDSRRQFNVALQRAADVLQENQNYKGWPKHKVNQQPNSNMPLFAHFTRRISAFHSVLELAESLKHYLKRHNWEVMETKKSSASPSSWLLAYVLGGFRSFVNDPWLWHDPDTFRLAVKTAVGMFLGSMFVSIPYLYNIAAPFAMWPGLTIASVNLADTGSSFRKAGDRLFGTLLAAAYALLVTDLFPGTQDYVKIPAIGFFTFIMIYFRDDQHSYAYTYAACSIGAMLYGSVMNDVDIAGYIPKRIELIVTGLVIFSIVELSLFPRSSRRLVEVLSLEFFTTIRNFAKQATTCAQLMEALLLRPDSSSMTGIEQHSITEKSDDDPLQLQKLNAIFSDLRSLNSKLKNEIESGLAEPRVGLSLELDGKSFRGISVEVSGCEAQAAILVQSFQSFMDEFNSSKGGALPTTATPHLPARHPLSSVLSLQVNILGHIHRVTEATRNKLDLAYPDGRLRPQSSNAVRSVLAASCLRELQDVRLRALSDWAAIYVQSIRNDQNENSGVAQPAVAIMTLSVTTTVILDLCRHLQDIGRHVESIAHKFPSSN